MNSKKYLWALFYNQAFDCLFAYSTNYKQEKLYHKEEKGDLYCFYEQDQLVSWHCNYFSKFYPKPIQNGINSDNKPLKTFLNQWLLEQQINNFIPFNQEDQFLIGQIKEINPVPNSYVSLCTVAFDNKKDDITLICGANNINKDDLVVVAQEGAIMPSLKVILKTNVYGHESRAMICSSQELGLANQKAGVLFFEKQQINKIGESFFDQYHE